MVHFAIYRYTYCNRAKVKKDLGDARGAIEDYTEVIGLNPNYESAYFDQGNVRNNLGDYQEALVDFTRVIYLRD